MKYIHFFISVIVHKFWVLKYITRFVFQIIGKGLVHDLSKFHKDEFFKLSKVYPELFNVKYGTKEYEQLLKDLKLPLLHHYKCNRHHLEYFSNNIRGMNLLDLIELYCDWLSSIRKNKNGDIFKSINYNVRRFKISNDLKAILTNQATKDTPK